MSTLQQIYPNLTQVVPDIRALGSTTASQRRKLDGLLGEKKITVENIQLIVDRKKTVEDVKSILKLINKKAKKVILYCIPKELELFNENKKTLFNELNMEIEIYAINDKDKYDPEGKAKKAKPSKPAIFLE